MTPVYGQPYGSSSAAVGVGKPGESPSPPAPHGLHPPTAAVAVPLACGRQTVVPKLQTWLQVQTQDSLDHLHQVNLMKSRLNLHINKCTNDTTR